MSEGLSHIRAAENTKELIAGGGETEAESSRSLAAESLI